MISVNNALVQHIKILIYLYYKKAVKKPKASTIQSLVSKQQAHSVSFVKVKPQLSLQLLSCHGHADKLMFMMLQHPFMVEDVILLMV